MGIAGLNRLHGANRQPELAGWKKEWWAVIWTFLGPLLVWMF
jgi:hypothetical protein